MIENVKTEEEEEERQLLQMSNEMSQSQTLVLQDNLIVEVEKSGFPKPYVVNSLNSDELNYATTFYFLLTTNKEF